MEQGASPTARRHLIDAVVAKHNATNAIAAGQGPPAPDRRGFGGNDRAQRAAAGEEHRDALINNEPGGAFALFGIHPELGFAAAGAGAPVDVAGVVAGQVGPQFDKVQAAAAHA